MILGIIGIKRARERERERERERKKGDGNVQGLFIDNKFSRYPIILISPPGA